MSAAEESANFGRSLAARMGKPAPPNVDWAAWGAAAKNAMESRPPKPVPPFERFVKQADVLQMPPMAPAEARAIVREARAIDFIEPRTVKDVIRLRELNVITRADARRYLGLRVHWWSR
jgi:hypothetical protein